MGLDRRRGRGGHPLRAEPSPPSTIGGGGFALGVRGPRRLTMRNRTKARRRRRRRRRKERRRKWKPRKTSWRGQCRKMGGLGKREDRERPLPPVFRVDGGLGPRSRRPDLTYNCKHKHARDLHVFRWAELSLSPMPSPCSLSPLLRHARWRACCRPQASNCLLAASDP